MWVSSIKSLFCRRYVKNVNLSRFYHVSALGRLKPIFSNPIPQDSVVAHSQFLEFDRVGVVGALNGLRKDPNLAFSLFKQWLEPSLNGFWRHASLCWC
ncbi:hypothetical protein Tsubulata_028585 [Turnera subulata]|uniref:Uncharacterized protein n=1 Tax=Turnera subulata TaxID=218843 RepID=A0A9Q0F5R7_9ROSI|nr:hypothetical protein Tsubulata_028585 [Turnera subulata]